MLCYQYCHNHPRGVKCWATRTEYFDRIIAKRVRDPREAMAMGLAPNQLEYLVKWKSQTYDGVSAAVAGRAGGGCTRQN